MKGPRYAVIAVTYRCNGRCVMCNIWRQKAGAELSPESYLSLPQTLASINLTGGEPFLRDDLARIVSVLRKRCQNPRIVVSSNGINFDSIKKQVPEMLKCSPRVGIRISIDGTGEMHDKIRGVAGAFESAVKSVEICRRAGVKDLGIAFTILPENVHELAKVYDLSRRLKVQFAVSIAQNAEIFFKVNNIGAISDPSALKNELGGVIKDQLLRMNPKDWFRAYYMAGLFDYSMGKSPLATCPAADDFFFMDPEGGIFICPLLDKKLGAIKSASFEDIWRSQTVRDAREFARSCSKRCWMACTVTPFIRANFFKVISWIAAHKIKAHAGRAVI